jgi:hypothetical protein
VDTRNPQAAGTVTPATAVGHAETVAAACGTAGSGTVHCRLHVPAGNGTARCGIGQHRHGQTDRSVGWCCRGPGATVVTMTEWWSIEVFDGPFSSTRWKDAYGSSLIESAISNGAVDWTLHQHRSGVVFAALDAVPDPVNGLLVYRGRGGSAGASARRRPRPHAGAGAVALPEPHPDPIEEEDFEPYWIESGFYDDTPEPMPDPSPLDEPAAVAPDPTLE